MSAGAFRKDRPRAPAGFFRAEAAGLRWLGQASTAGGAAVVAVLDVGDGFIELEQVRHVAPSQRAAEQFGRALALTHAAGAATFGSPPAGWDGTCYIGRQVLPTGSFSRWGAFYAALRIRPYADTALRIGNLGEAEYASVRAVCDRLARGDFDDDSPPARIHGDLWAGNVLFGASGVVLIDPAAHGGHRETDLAMLELFGAPHLGRILDAYYECASVGAGAEDRVGLHQLHPLLVHAVSHGPSYGREAGRVASRYV